MGPSLPPITKNLIIINVLFYFATIVFQIKGIDLSVFLGAYYPESPNFKIWEILTHMFMHASYPNISHILFNMFALWMFGSAVEQTFGPKKFLIMYFLAGFGGFILFNLVNYFQIQPLKEAIVAQGFSLDEIYTYSKLNVHGALYNLPENFRSTQEVIDLINFYRTPMVGASGAIYGLLVAFAVLFPDAKLALIFFPVPIKAKYFIPIMIGVELFMGVQNYSWNNVAHFAHLGGGLIGFLLARSWKKNLYRRN